MLLLQPLLRKHRAALDAQEVFLDADGLVESFYPLLKLVREMQGIWAHKVNLSSTSLDPLLRTEDTEVDELPEDLRRLKDHLKELRVQSARLSSLPDWLGELKHLESLNLDGTSAYMMSLDDEEIPNDPWNYEMTMLPTSIGDLGVLKRMHLSHFEGLQKLPESIKRLTALEELRLEGLGQCKLEELTGCFPHLKNLQEIELLWMPALETLPATLGSLTSLQRLGIRCCGNLKKLPENFGLLKALRTLNLVGLHHLKKLPASIGELTGLEELGISHSGIEILPTSMKFLTTLHTLSIKLWWASNPSQRDSNRVFKTLSPSLPFLRRLRRLAVNFSDFRGEAGKEDSLAIGRSLRAWPLPLLLEFSDTLSKRISVAPPLNVNWHALGLPAEAEEWDNLKILDYFRVQQAKMAAFASGLHVRLGQASCLSSLNDLILVLIADEVLGGRSLSKEEETENTDSLQQT
jgi:Leucine-rich repeat (LRR) protein